MAAEIIVEVGPHSHRSMLTNSLHPHGKLLGGVVVVIPPRPAVKSNIYFVTCLYQVIRQARGTTRAEDGVGLSKRDVGLFIPPTGMTEFDDVSHSRIELVENSLEPRRAVVEARRDLKEKASHVGIEQPIDEVKILHQRSSSRKLFDVGN